MGKLPVLNLLKKNKKEKNIHAFTLEERRTNSKIVQIRVGRHIFLNYKEINQVENSNT